MVNLMKSVFSDFGLPNQHGLYHPTNEKDACGVGFVAHVKGRRSHQIVLDAEIVLRNMDHRGACGCEADTGDGAGMMTALPHRFLAKVAQEDLSVRLPEPGRFSAGLASAGRAGVVKARILEEKHHLADQSW